MAKGNGPPESLETRLLEKLKQHATRKGLTYSEIAKTCGKKWRQALALSTQGKAKEARAQDVKDFVYRLWQNGLVFVEPPKGRKNVPRIWDMESGCAAFTSVGGPHTFDDPAAGKVHDVEMLRSAYDRFVREYLGGYVPVFKVRRALEWPKERFDQVMRDLNERREPVVELHGGDPRNYRDDEIADSYTSRSNLYLLMRWRT